ncbi:MAG: divalent-cation tolerance protein CutA [Candidatus Diapherotrites archaeon]|nr:divalent-cation tolerance protein CutA [Candidatus Diapherotrites archaeon]
MPISLVYITFKNQKEADKIVAALFKDKLIACSASFEVDSKYVWKGKLEKSKEIAAICKTKPALTNHIKAKVKELHSYDTPCIIFWEAEANEEYKNWIFSSTANLF